MARRVGRHTIELERRVSVLSRGVCVGKKEKQGPLGGDFGCYYEDTTLGCDSWEKSETTLQKAAFSQALNNASGLAPSLILGGDLLNQCVASSHAVANSGIPFAGLYGACSTMAESLAMAALLCDSGAVDIAAAIASSHFCAAERQFRFPLEYGGVRAPSSQWTVTGSGCVFLGVGSGISVKQVCFGAVCDMDVKDINNMGAAMAPAAADTLCRFFEDTGSEPQDYDAIFTGDLGLVGSRVLPKLLASEGHVLCRHNDCGLMIFDREVQNVNSGGSGAGCCASVLCGHILPKMERRELKRILFVATGALMSTTSYQQGSAIPSIAHLCELEITD